MSRLLEDAFREGDDEDLAVRVLEHVVDRRREEPRLPAPPGRGPEHDQVGLPPLGLVDDRVADRARVEAITVVQVPRERALDAPLPADVAQAAADSIAEAKVLGEENEVEVHAEAVHARSIGHAIVDEAERRRVDLIVLGSSPRWRRQSRFFSPTVDHVLKHAHCEVLVVAFPEGVFEQV